MKRFTAFIAIAVMSFVIGCTGTPEQAARDAIAGAHGFVVSAKATWGDSCRADATQVKCTSTNKLIDAEHLAATALGTYCGGTAAPAVASYSAGGACVPVKSAEQALLSAVMNMNAIVEDVKSLLARGN